MSQLFVDNEAEKMSRHGQALSCMAFVVPGGSVCCKYKSKYFHHFNPCIFFYHICAAIVLVCLHWACSNNCNVKDALKKDLQRLKEDFKATCKNFSFEGKLIGLETTDDLQGNANWNSLRSETKVQLKTRFALNPGDYLWLALGDKDKAVRLIANRQQGLLASLLSCFLASPSYCTL